MNTYEKISEVARDLYEKSGRIDGRDLENWHEAERIVRESLESLARGKTVSQAGEKKISEKKSKQPSTTRSTARKSVDASLPESKESEALTTESSRRAPSAYGNQGGKRGARRWSL
jgi:hypothetical protein